MSVPSTTNICKLDNPHSERAEKQGQEVKYKLIKGRALK